TWYANRRSTRITGTDRATATGMRGGSLSIPLRPLPVYRGAPVATRRQWQGPTAFHGLLVGSPPPAGWTFHAGTAGHWSWHQSYRPRQPLVPQRGYPSHGAGADSPPHPSAHDGAARSPHPWQSRYAAAAGWLHAQDAAPSECAPRP